MKVRGSFNFIAFKAKLIKYILKLCSYYRKHKVDLISLETKTFEETIISFIGHIELHN